MDPKLFHTDEPFDGERRAAINRRGAGRNRFPAFFYQTLFPWKRSEVELLVSGSYASGGRVLIREGAFDVMVTLPPVVFTVLATLIIAAKQSLGRKPYSAAGFVSANDLGRALDRWSYSGGQQDAIKDILTLRERIAEAWSRHMPRRKANEWARELIETDQSGYRLSTNPLQLHLDIVAPIQ